MKGLLQDVHYALRQLRKNPSFAALVAITVGVGLGATTATFSLVDRALFRSLPYPNDGQLVSVGVMAPIIEGEFLFAGSYLRWKHEQTPFSGLTSSTGVHDCDLTEDRPLRLTCGAVDAAFLPAFGIRPALGRNFTAEEDRPTAPRVALLSYGLWQSRFGGARDILDRTVALDGQATRVVGVLPRDFEFPTLARVSVLVPEALDEAALLRNGMGPVVRVYGRMKPGLSITAATSQLQPLFQNFVESAPPPFRKVLRLQVRSLRDLQVHDSRLAAWLLLASALAVLLISCANAAGLLLTRGLARRHELAVQLALGAGRFRIVQQRLTEALVLAAVGGICGCVLAWAIVHALAALAPAGVPRLSQASIDGRVLFFMGLMSLTAGILFGTIPALERPSIEALVTVSPVGRRSLRLRHAMLIGQVAMSIVLFAGALLFVRSLRNLQNRPLGMNTQNVVTAQISLGQQKYASALQRLAFFEELERRLEALPGMSAVAISDSLPPAAPARTMPFIALQAEGQQALPPEQGIGGVVGWRSVTPNYFAALGIPLLQGRNFVEQDRIPGPGAIILNSILAKQLLPGQPPLGKTIRFKIDDQHSSPPLVVVGVSGNTENEGLSGSVGPEYYVVRRHAADDIVFRYPDSQRASIIARSPLTSTAVAQELASAVSSLDPTIPVQNSTLASTVYAMAQRSRFTTALISLFAMLSALLASAGIYGLVSLIVGQSARDIAVRIALGADPIGVTRYFVARMCKWVALGTVAGIVAALLAARSMSAFLFGIAPTDPLTLATAAGALLAMGLLAAYIPARRAAKVDPMVALRYE